MATDSNRVSNADSAQSDEFGAAERRKRHSLTIVYTGNGKGKTTAAIGLVVRRAGSRVRAFFRQFIKGQWKSGQREILRSLPGVELR